jgi:cell wall-associated NlpC family hydrolase
MTIKSFICALALSLAVFAPSFAQDSTVSPFANDLSRAAYEKADQVFNDATNVHYEHLKELARDQVHFDNNGCAARTDCSGFVSYVLHAVSPKHYEEVRAEQPDRPYPQAAAYEHFLHSCNSDQPEGGWLRISSIRDLRAGDIIAWSKPHSPENHAGKGNTGHVMFVAEPPQSVQSQMVEGQRIRFVPIKVIDSSSVRHFAPEQLPPHAGQSDRDGLGKGEVRVIVDENDRPIGYWEGTYWGEGHKDINHPSMTDSIAFGRLIPFSQSR